MYIYMYILKPVLYEPRPSEILNKYPRTALRYGVPFHAREQVVKIPVIIDGAVVNGYINNCPLYTESDFMEFLPNIKNIRNDVVIKVVG